MSGRNSKHEAGFIGGDSSWMQEDSGYCCSLLCRLYVSLWVQSINRSSSRCLFAELITAGAIKGKVGLRADCGMSNDDSTNLSHVQPVGFVLW